VSSSHLSRGLSDSVTRTLKGHCTVYSQS